jgi:hypothetical protein
MSRLKEVPGVFSQGASLKELEENIKDAYKLMSEEEEDLPYSDIQRKELEVMAKGPYPPPFRNQRKPLQADQKTTWYRMNLFILH